MTPNSYQIEAWAELGAGCLFVLARTCARWKIVGLRKFRADDYLIILMMVS